MSDQAPDAEDDAASEPVHERELLHGCPVAYSRGQRVVHVGRDGYVELFEKLHEEGWLTCIDLTAVDFLAHPGRELPDGVEPERFEVVVSLLSHRQRARLRVRVQVPEADPVVPTLWALYPGTEALEREVFDMFGIGFSDHPDLTRILMPEDWIGHPLRKDYDSGRIPVQFKATPGR